MFHSGGECRVVVLMLGLVVGLVPTISGFCTNFMSGTFY